MKHAFLNARMPLSLTVLLCFIVTTLHAQNLVANGNLAGEGFADWTLYNPSGDNGGNAGLLSNPTGLQFPPGTDNAAGLAAFSALYQDITTVPGQAYYFSFYATAFTSSGGTSPLNMIPSFGSTALPELTLYGSPSFLEYNYEATATSTSTMIQFSNPNANRWPMFTDISVVAVPEPGTLFTSIASLLLLGGHLLREKCGRQANNRRSSLKLPAEPSDRTNAGCR
jgi:hypothetical protein